MSVQQPHPGPPGIAPSRSLIHLTGHVHTFLRERLWLQVLVGMAAGLGVGVALAPGSGLVAAETGQLVGAWLALPGNLFLAAIKFVVVPLVLSSVVRGIAAGDDPQSVGQIGLRTVLFFLATTVLAIVIGFAVALSLRPGQFIDSASVTASLGAVGGVPAPASGAAAGGLPGVSELPERIVGLLPTNPHAALASGEMLQIVIGAMIFGIALLMVPREQGKPLLDLLGGVQAACMALVTWVMRLAPLAVFGLLAQIASRIGLGAILGMAAYVGAVLAGLLLLLLAYLAIVALVARRPPLAFLGAVRELMLIAFSTSSSAAVMPLSLQTAEQKLHVNPRISRFVIPLGTTINMGGTALYQAVAALFLAQVFGVEIGPSGMLLILVTATGAAIGSPGTPGMGIVILATILTSVGIPEAGIALILGVDRILDMCRTAVNVTGDVVACAVLDRWVAIPAPVPAAAGDG